MTPRHTSPSARSTDAGTCPLKGNARGEARTPDAHDGKVQ